MKKPNANKGIATENTQIDKDCRETMVLIMNHIRGNEKQNKGGKVLSDQEVDLRHKALMNWV